MGDVMEDILSRLRKSAPHYPQDKLSTSELTDNLIEHIGIFEGAKDRLSGIKCCPERKSVLEWFRSLSPQQRQRVLTVDDVQWVQMVIKMFRKLAHEGQVR